MVSASLFILTRDFEHVLVGARDAVKPGALEHEFGQRVVFAELQLPRRRPRLEVDTLKEARGVVAAGQHAPDAILALPPRCGVAPVSDGGDVGDLGESHDRVVCRLAPCAHERVAGGTEREERRRAAERE